jgi:hypothetical protein
MCYDTVSYYDTSLISLFINWCDTSDFCQHTIHNTAYDTSIVASLRANFLPYKATIYWLAKNLVRFCLPKDQHFGWWPNFRKVRLGNNSNIVFSLLPLCPLKSLRSSPSSVHDWFVGKIKSQRGGLDLQLDQAKFDHPLISWWGLLSLWRIIYGLDILWKFCEDPERPP